MAALAQSVDVCSRILASVDLDLGRMRGDFADLGGRVIVDNGLQRLAAVGELRSIGRGPYDRRRKDELTSRPAVPNYRAVTRAIACHDYAHAVIDGMAAANDFGLTISVPAICRIAFVTRLSRQRK